LRTCRARLRSDRSCRIP